ncbi:MAG: hypothetical protein ACE5MM_08115 [Nitrospiraceae bacterium]
MGTSPTALLLAAIVLHASVGIAAPSVDELTDLTGGTSVVVTQTGHDTFTNEYRYDVSVRNQTAYPLDADSLVVVLDQITDLAGKDAVDRIEVVGQDGETADGKPYFRIPVEGPTLAPYSDSQPATVRLRNPAYTIVFTPSFRVRGLRRPTPSEESVQSLLDVLIKKGLVAEDEIPTTGRPSPPPEP